MALPTKTTQLNEIASIDTFYNGGKGSGNFGHAGRPGEIGGSSARGARGASKSTIEKKGGKTAADKIYDDPRGKYADGFDSLERAKDFIVGHAGEMEGIGEEIAMAYEDGIRKKLGFKENEDLSYDDLMSVYDETETVLSQKSLEDLEKDLGKDVIDDAIDCALRQGGLEYALGNAKLGQAGLTHDDAMRDLKSFIVDFGLVDHYGATKAAESGYLKTAWRDIAYDLADKIDDEYGRSFGREYFERIDK